MEIRVLGECCAVGADRGLKNLERKTAALLAYLALEGPTARGKLAGMLWPETRDETARNNLRQLLLRLKRLIGQECLEGGDPLKLREGLPVDVLHLRAAFESKDYVRVVSFEAELLQDLTYDDCSELSEWLEGWRLKLRDTWLKAMEAELLLLEREGQLKEAIELALRLLARERKSETAYRHLMRLSHRLGDRAAALKAYRQCQDMVMQEFGALPSQETRELAREIEHSEATRPRPAVPLSVMHPPVLAGREREWALMEEAWAARQPMLVDGESGIGKSRLVRDFGYSRGRCLLINGRPGDQQLPYVTHIRNLREVLRLVPDAPMQPWVRRELSRLLPELMEDAPPLPQSPQERTRLFSAVIEFLRGTLPGMDVLVFDDAQYMDRDSAELGIQVHSEFREEMKAGRFPLIINVFRTSDVGEWVRQQIQTVIQSGLMSRVQVGRLDAAAVKKMLEGMDEPASDQAVEQMMAYTGGNPLFIVESVRHRRQPGGVDGQLPDLSSPPALIRMMIEQRLKLLTPEALHLARVFAVARTDFSVELASKVLEVPVVQLAALLQELEEADVSKGQWFVHDLMCEVILATMPKALRPFLTERIERFRRPS